MNDGAGTEKEQRFEKAMRDQVHDPGRDTADAERDHHQAELRDGGVSEDAFNVELREGDERRHQRGDRRRSETTTVSDGVTPSTAPNEKSG